MMLATVHEGNVASPAAKGDHDASKSDFSDQSDHSNRVRRRKMPISWKKALFFLSTFSKQGTYIA